MLDFDNRCADRGRALDDGGEAHRGSQRGFELRHAARTRSEVSMTFAWAATHDEKHRAMAIHPGRSVIVNHAITHGGHIRDACDRLTRRA